MPFPRKRPNFWTPLNLGDRLALWIDSDEQGALGGTYAAVLTYADKSPYGRHSASIVGGRPTAVDAAQNGRRSIRYSGAVLAGTIALSGSLVSIFAVGRLTNTATASGRLVALAPTGAADSAAGSCVIRRVTTTEAVSTFVNAGQQTAHTITYGTTFMIGVVVNGTGVSSRINGGAAQTAAITPSFATVARYSVGVSLAAAAPGTAYWNDDIHEVIIYDGVIDDAVRFPLEGYLSAKWFPTPVLPTTHPYYSVRP